MSKLSLSRRKNVVYALVLGCLLAAGLAGPFLSASRVSAGPPEQTPEMRLPADWMTPPPTVDSPSQADEGAQVYYYYCLVCHGDRGQGLAEWRQTLQPPDNNCFQSKCHVQPFPEDPRVGFAFPENVPAVIAPGKLIGYGNAQNLYTFLKTRMPWQMPGMLADEEYWQLTAYLMRANGYALPARALDAGSAAGVSLQEPAPVRPALESAGLFYWLGGAGLLLAALALGLVWLRRVKQGN